MGINAKIFGGIRHNTYEYGFDPWTVEDFLTAQTDFLTRQADAIDIIEDIMTAYKLFS